MTDTESLLDQLAQDGALPAQDHLRRFAMPLLAVLAACAIGVLLVFGKPFAAVAEFGPGPMLVKWGFSLSLLLLSTLALWVLGKPGRTARWAVAGALVPFVPVIALLWFELSIIGPVLEGETWRQCLAAMGIMSPIAFAAAILAMRALAPTNLRRSGLIAGLFGGAVAMTAYAPFCPELGMLYMAVFYCLPMIAMAAIGWLAGPRLLRW